MNNIRLNDGSMVLIHTYADIQAVIRDHLSNELISELEEHVISDVSPLYTAYEKLLEAVDKTESLEHATIGEFPECIKSITAILQESRDLMSKVL